MRLLFIEIASTKAHKPDVALAGGGDMMACRFEGGPVAESDCLLLAAEGPGPGPPIGLSAG